LSTHARLVTLVGMTRTVSFNHNAFRHRDIVSVMASAFTMVLLCAAVQTASAQPTGMTSHDEAVTGRWQKLVNQPTFQTDSAVLLTDGTVMMHEYNSNHWWRLTPDNTGSYLKGTWSQLASMSSNYAPLYYASAVLKDGRVLVEGGEYNHLQQVETNMGAIYDPVANSWTTVNPPAGWGTIGDAPCAVLNDGTFTLGQAGVFTTNQVNFNSSTLTWTAVGSGKADPFVEEGFAKLPNGNLLTVDCENGTNSETYNPTTHQWTSAGSTIVKLPDAGFLEIGPMMQRPDGTVAAFGGTPHTALYNIATGTWAAGPDVPAGNDMADAPCAILPDGNILVYTSPGVFQGSGTLYLFDGTTYTEAPATQSSGSHQSWQGRMLLLPTGEILMVVADGRVIDAELFASKGRANAAWAPTITSLPATATRGATIQISGTQFNGLDVGADYGDDGTMSSNYPIVRIKNRDTGHVFYARTHDHSTMGIATGSTVVSTMVDIPAGMETGAANLTVVANGIASRSKQITIQ
jgi:hypothetical protein